MRASAVCGEPGAGASAAGRDDTKITHTHHNTTRPSLIIISHLPTLPSQPDHVLAALASLGFDAFLASTTKAADAAASAVAAEREARKGGGGGGGGRGPAGMSEEEAIALQQSMLAAARDRAAAAAAAGAGGGGV